MQSKKEVLPLRETVFNMIQRRVNENARVVPSTRLDTNSLVNQGVLGEVLAGDGDC